MMEWISVEDRLPEIKFVKRYLLCYCEVIPTPRDMDAGHKKHYSYRIGFVPIGTSKIYPRTKEGQKFYDINVKYWRELPEPPKED